MESGSRKTEPSEQEVRSLYLRNAPSVEGDETWEAIEARVNRRGALARPRRGRPGRGRRRVALVWLTAVIIAGAVTFGIYEAVTHLRGSGQMLVIGDDGAMPLATGEAITVSSPSGGTVTLTGEEADLYREIQWIREGLASGDIVLDQEPVFRILSADIGSDAEADTFLRSWVESVASDPYLVLDQTEGALLDTTDAIVYLETSVGADQASALHAEIAVMPEVQSALLVTKQMALERIKELYSDKPEIWDNLTSNPLPDSIEIRLKSRADLDSFVERFNDRPEVDEVRRASSPTVRDPQLTMLELMVFGVDYSEAVRDLLSAAGASTLNGRDATSTSVTTVDPSSFRTVLHPYHNSYLDYLGAYANGLPQVDPAVETAIFPSVIPAYQAEVRPLPETDLQFELVTRGDSDVVSYYSWMDPEAESYVTSVTGPTTTAYVPRQPLFDAGSTQAAAVTFLKEHGLWQPDLVVGEVTWKSYETPGPDGINEGWFDYWVVRFDQSRPDELAADSGSFPGAVRVHIDSSGRSFEVRWSLLDLTRDGDLRLRPLQEVLTDLDAWTGGSISGEVNEWLGESHPQMAVSGASLGLVRNDYARADDVAARYLVPVYEFTVEPLGADGLPGIWYVVAAQDTTP